MAVSFFVGLFAGSFFGGSESKLVVFTHQRNILKCGALNEKSFFVLLWQGSAVQNRQFDALAVELGPHFELSRFSGAIVLFTPGLAPFWVYPF